MSFLDTVKTGSTGEKVALAPGNYGTKSQPGLKILMYGDWSKPDKNGTMRHSFLVAATQPSNESKKAKGTANGNGFPDAPEDDFEGTAFMTVPLNDGWLNAEAAALAFTEVSRPKDSGDPQADYVQQAIEAGEITVESAQKAQAYYVKVATDKLLAANTPADKVEEAIPAQYHKEMQQIAIALGLYFRLLDWAGVSRSQAFSYDVKKLVDVQFSGSIKESDNPGKDGNKVSEVAGIKEKK